MIEEKRKIGKGERAIYDKWEAGKQLSMGTIEHEQVQGWVLGVGVGVGGGCSEQVTATTTPTPTDTQQRPTNQSNNEGRSECTRAHATFYFHLQR